MQKNLPEKNRQEKTIRKEKLSEPRNLSALKELDHFSSN